MIDVEILSTAMNKALHLRNVSGSLKGKNFQKRLQRVNFRSNK